MKRNVEGVKKTYIFFCLNKFKLFAKKVCKISFHYGPGQQTLFDLVLHDHVQIAQICGSICAVVIIVSRFESVAQFISNNSTIACFICTLFTLASACYHTNLNFVFIARFVCLLDMAFVEALVSEKLARIIITLTTLCGSLAVTLAQAHSGELASGSVLSMLTGKYRAEGV